MDSTFLSALRKASFIRDEETWLSLKFPVQSERCNCVYAKDGGTECSMLCPTACSVNFFSSNLKRLNLNKERKTSKGSGYAVEQISVSSIIAFTVLLKMHFRRAYKVSALHKQ